MSVVFEFGAYRKHVAATFYDGTLRNGVFREAQAACVLVEDGFDSCGQRGILDFAEIVLVHEGVPGKMRMRWQREASACAFRWSEFGAEKRVRRRLRYIARVFGVSSDDSSQLRALMTLRWRLRDLSD